LIIDVKEHEYFGVLMIRTEPGRTKEALASLEKVYKEINPNYPFAYQFLDQEYEKLYRNEQIVTKLSNGSALLAMIISCLGLLGLAMFSAEQRTAEFGIRKVLGASVSSIVGLLSQDFIKLVLVAFCIAAPLAGYFMYQWLQSFAYKIELSWWIFAASGAFAIFIALITVSTQAFRSAMNNPIKALRSE
jgi:ABC-type antimicrobial peptide transport system permease subunit